VLKRKEYFVLGDALSHALRSLRLANSIQPVIISEPLYALVKPFFTFEEVKITFTSGNGHYATFGGED